MKKLLFSLFMIISGLVLQAQDIRFILKERKLRSGEMVIDTVWQIKKISSKINESNELILDTAWIKFNKNRTNSFSSTGITTIPSTTNSILLRQPSSVFQRGRGFIGVFGNTSIASSLGIEGVKLGYFVADNQVIGGGGQIGFSKNAGVNLSGFYRSFFGNGSKGKFWGEINSNLVAVSGQTSFGFGLGVGYTSLITNSIGFDTGLKYQKLGEFKGDLTLNFGLIFLLGN
jgi:hypothetical protein